MVVRKCGFGDFHMDFLGWGMLHTCRIYEAYPFESSADVPFNFFSVIGPVVVGVIFILF